MKATRISRLNVFLMLVLVLFARASATCSLLGYYIWFHVLERTDSSATSSFLFAEPLITVAFATVFTGENVNPYAIAGGILIFAGVYFVTTKRTNPNPRQRKP